MSKNKSFEHKIVYGICMIVILIAVSLISRPATSDQPGGTLAQMRTDYGISDAQLGKVDPASEAMRLSLLGLDGVAITFLWSSLNEYQMTEQYTMMEATARTISYLNPHLLKVWEFQAWNMSYNVSREFDNYQHRYLWVKRGINYHMEGTEYNYNEPRMMNSIGHFFGNKFGNADEKKQYREIFPDDEPFHENIRKHVKANLDFEAETEGIVPKKPDNWLVARVWNKWAVQSVDLEGGQIGMMSPTIFYQYPAKRLMNFAEAIESEGHFSEKARGKWKQSADEWKEFGNHELKSTWGIMIRLNESEKLGADIEENKRQFDAAYGEYMDKLHEEKLAKLPKETQAAIKTPEADRTEEQIALVQAAEPKLNVNRLEVVTYMEEQKAPGVLDAARLANTINEDEFVKGVIDRQKEIVNFDYWRARANSEKTLETLQARELVYQAHEDYKNADLVNARKKYEEAWEKWVKIYDESPTLREDASSDILADSMKEYRLLLNQFDEDITPDFPFLDILRRNSPEGFIEPTLNSGKSPAADKTSDDKPKEMTPEKSEPKPEEPKEEKPAEEKPAAEKPMPEESKPESTDKPAAEKPEAEKPAAAEATPEPSDEKPAEPASEKADEATPSPEKAETSS
ncbi:hypothetical protein GC197_14810 [bacterium]|nr:hypothetical protein [bacterium]